EHVTRDVEVRGRRGGDDDRGDLADEVTVVRRRGDAQLRTDAACTLRIDVDAGNEARALESRELAGVTLALLAHSHDRGRQRLHCACSRAEAATRTRLPVIELPGCALNHRPRIRKRSRRTAA